MLRARHLVLAGLAVVALVAWGAHRALGPGLAFLGALVEEEAPAASAVVRDELSIPGRNGAIPARWYRPPGASRRTVVVVHGVHTDGYDEARLVRFARQLARRGDLVLTPDVASLRGYTIELAAVDAIEDSVAYVVDREAPARPALVGISFAGGLALVAAARPALAGRLSSLLSFGGHADLLAVQRYLIDGRLEDGAVLTPHLYAQAVLARELAGQLVPADQIAPLRGVLSAFLRGDQQAFVAGAAALAPPADAIADACQRWDAPALGQLLAAARLEPDPRLSPVRGPPPELPIYLLHGEVDNVIPPSQARALARWAGPRARLLVSPLISHVELGKTGSGGARLVQTARLAAFLSAWLDR